MFLSVITIASVAAAIAFALVAWRVVRNDQRRSDARVAALASAIDGPPVEPVSMVSPSLFENNRRSAMQGRPLLKVAIGFAMAVAVIVAIAMTDDRGSAPAPMAASANKDALELVSMRHTRNGDSLTVTGLVRNPGGAAAERVIAVVLAFDRGGSFVASGRAPLEFATLTQGDESPFQVTIPNVIDVGRYRVSFRTELGVVRHVDRRTLQAAN